MTESANQIIQSSGPTATSSATTGSFYQDLLDRLTSILFLNVADERAAITGERRPEEIAEDLRDACAQIKSVLAELRAHVR